MTKETTVNDAELLIDSSLIIRPHTAKEEFDYLLDNVYPWMPFYRENRYSVALPYHAEFIKLVDEPTQLESLDREWLFEIFQAEVYQSNFYRVGLEHLESRRHIVASTFPTFKELNGLWGFKNFPVYEVTLTAYGSGGEYDHEGGGVVMMVREDGTFKVAKPELGTIHELVHIGIEEPIVLAFNLTHGEKERLVDKICKIKFPQLFCDLPYQASGDHRIDPYITHEALENLPVFVAKYIGENPR